MARIDSGRSRRGRDRRGAPAKALGDRAQQLGGRWTEAVGMLLLEHGDERPNICLSEAPMSGLERAAEDQREVAVALRDARAGRSRRRDLAHDLAGKRDDLAVEIEFDVCLCHCSSMAG
jgi:hypothetical protein